MRIIYLYTMNGAGKAGEKHDGPTENSYALNIGTEGFFYLFKRLLDLRIVDEVLIVIESNRSPGVIQYSSGLSCRVMPHITDLWRYLRDDDVLFVRGGFKFWHDTLAQIAAKGNWLMFYGAATQRWRWLFWDLVLNDLIDKLTLDSAGRIQYPFHKPTHPMLFSFDPVMKRDYDVCIGASHIHDKKGQWMGVDMLLEYRRQFESDIKAVMPGRSTGGGKTKEMFEKIGNLPIDQPGMLPRIQMINIYNRSKLYLHYGGAGQNDRGVLEAMACGCPVAIMDTRKQYHPPDVWEFVYKMPQDPEIGARMVNIYLATDHKNNRTKTYEWFAKTHSMENVIIPEFKRVFDFFRDNRKADRNLLWNYLNSSTS